MRINGLINDRSTFGRLASPRITCLRKNTIDVKVKLYVLYIFIIFEINFFIILSEATIKEESLAILVSEVTCGEKSIKSDQIEQIIYN